MKQNYNQENYKQKFFEYTRMDFPCFEKLKGLIQPIIEPKSIRPGISVEEQLVLVLRYLATGDSYHDLSFQFRISVPAISIIIKKVLI